MAMSRDPCLQGCWCCLPNCTPDKLPHDVLFEISKVLDQHRPAGGQDVNKLATRLGFDCGYIWTDLETQTNSSKTMKLFRDCWLKGITVREIQQALSTMDTVAASILPRHSREIREFVAKRYPWSAFHRDGQENTETGSSVRSSTQPALPLMTPEEFTAPRMPARYDPTRPQYGGPPTEHAIPPPPDRASYPRHPVQNQTKTKLHHMECDSDVNLYSDQLTESSVGSSRICSLSNTKPLHVCTCSPDSDSLPHSPDDNVHVTRDILPQHRGRLQQRSQNLQLPDSSSHPSSQSGNSRDFCQPPNGCNPQHSNHLPPYSYPPPGSVTSERCANPPKVSPSFCLRDSSIFYQSSLPYSQQRQPFRDEAQSPRLVTSQQIGMQTALSSENNSRFQSVDLESACDSTSSARDRTFSARDRTSSARDRTSSDLLTSVGSDLEWSHEAGSFTRAIPKRGSRMKSLPLRNDTSDEDSGPDRTQCQPDVKPSVKTKKRRSHRSRPRLFVTGGSCVEEMEEIRKQLAGLEGLVSPADVAWDRRGFTVRKGEWKRHFESANVVIIGLTRSYLNDLNHLWPSRAKQINEAFQDALAATHEENRRFMNVLFSETGVKKADVPQEIKNYCVYKWPAEQKRVGENVREKLLS